MQKTNKLLGITLIALAIYLIVDAFLEITPDISLTRLLVIIVFSVMTVASLDNRNFAAGAFMGTLTAWFILELIYLNNPINFMLMLIVATLLSFGTAKLTGQ